MATWGSCHPEWEKEVSRFDWHYDTDEICYLLEGQVQVRIDDGETVQFGAGDLVRFPAGLSCTWNISGPAKKNTLSWVSRKHLVYIIS